MAEILIIDDDSQVNNVLTRVVKNLGHTATSSFPFSEGLESVSSGNFDVVFLDAHPILTEMCGFPMGYLPDESQFYRFLKEVPNGRIQKIHIRINKILIEKGIVTLDTFIMDSKPVKAATRENNHKNPNRNTTNKDKKLQQSRCQSCENAYQKAQTSL